jgi:hypothetical protein
MKPLLWILQFVFGCRHRHQSRVFTIKKPHVQGLLRLWTGIRLAGCTRARTVGYFPGRLGTG